MSRFSKPAYHISDQIDLLKSRGLLIPDFEEATLYLNNISYYRLSAYMRPFQEESSDHHFKKGIQFSQIIDLYVFDKELRILLMDPLERIEVALRAQLTNTLALKHGSDCLSNPSLFHPRYDHGWLMNTLATKLNASSSERFLKHYRNRYTEPQLPPIWMSLECLSFSEVSKLFQNLKSAEDKQPIISHFGWPETVLTSWFQALSVLRNTCAHHNRVWNKEFGIKPKLPYKKHQPKNWPNIDNSLEYGSMQIKGIVRRSRLVAMLIIIEALMKNISPKSQWHEQLFSLLLSRSPYELLAMGIEENWNQSSFWSKN